MRLPRIAAGLALALLAAGVGSVASGDSSRMAVTGAPVLSVQDPLDDPFPIRRIRLNEDQLDAALKEFDTGPVVRLARPDFEARVQKAALLAEEERERPRLVEASYSATLDGNDLTGEAEWVFANRRGTPALYSLEPLKFAVHSATWADGAVAILGSVGDSPDGGLGIRVPPGRQTLKLKWSSAGNGSDSDRQFDLRLPPCSTGALALDLTPDRTPATAADVLLTGPFPSVRDPKFRQWRIRLGERTRLDLGIRSSNDSGGPLVSAASVMKYDLSDSQLVGTFEFEMRTTRGTQAEWAFHVPPGLAVTDAIANDRAAWRFDAATRTLRIALRQAANSGKFVIAATGSIPAALAPLPAIKPLNAIGSAERIEIRVPPGAALDQFEPGDYRIADGSVAGDGTRTTVLVGSLVGADRTVRRPPSIRVVSAGAEYTTAETLDWRIDSNRVVMAVRVEVNVRRGPLFRIGFRTPPGFAADRIAGEPEEAITFTASTASGVELEFGKPLATGQRVALNFEYRGPVLPASGAAVPFPAFGPLGAAERDGRIQFAAGSSWSLAALPIGEANGDAAKGFRYRGVEPSGSLNLTPIAASFSAAIDAKEHRIRLTPTRGQLELVRFFEPGPPTKRTWGLLESANAIATATASPVGPLPLFSGTMWTLRFVRPSSEPLTLEMSPDPIEVLGASEVRVHTDPATTPDLKSGTGKWTFENLHFISVATREKPFAVFGGTVRTRGEGALPILLPRGMELQSAAVGANWIDPGMCPIDSEGRLRLPIPDFNSSLRFEVRYRLPPQSGTPFRLASPQPVLPADVPSVARWWAIPAEVSAVAPWGLKHPAAPTSLPVLIAPLETGLAFHRTDETELMLVPTSHLDVLGVAVAVLLAIAGWIGCRHANRTLGILLLLVLLATGAAFRLGPDAWQRVALPSLIAALIGSGTIAAARGWKTPTRTRTVAALLVLLPTFAATAQAPAIRDVALILSRPGGEIAIVPRSLLDRLERDAKPTDPAFVIGSASYTGVIEDGLARFTARFKVHALRDGESALELPLSDVRLERATVNGQPAQPLAAMPDAYSLAMPGRGMHEVEIRFSAVIGMNGPEREVRIGIPLTPDSRVAFTAPLTARQLQAVNRTGSERASRDKDSNRIETMLGAVRSLHLRWREGPAGAAATLAVREGCIWDVSESAHRLTACYQIQVKSGSVPSFRFDVPAHLEPTRVAVRSLDSLLVPTVVRDWSFGKEASAWRPLTIELLAPADGRVLVTLECELRTAPVRQPVLTFPKPVGMTRESAVYGLRTSGVVAESIGRTGVIDFASDALIRDFGAVLDLRLSPASPLVAFSPRAGETGELRPALRVGGTLPSVSQEVVWSLEPARAMGHGKLSWSEGDAAALIEFQIPATIAELRGAELEAWRQTNGSVQAWLKKPLKEGSLEWIASIPVAATFELPQAAIMDARHASRTVRVRTAAGLGIRIDRDKGWRPIASDSREWAFQCVGSLPPPRVQLFPPGPASARGFGLLEFGSDAIAMRASLEIATAPDQPQHLVLQASGLPVGATPILDVPPGTIVHERMEPAGSFAWDLDVPGSSATTFRATVGMSLPAKGTVALPTIDLRNGSHAANVNGVLEVVGLSGTPPGVVVTGVGPATAGPELVVLQAAWPGEAERLRRAGGTIRIRSGRIAIAFPSPDAPAPPIARPMEATSATTPIPAASRAAWVSAAAWCGTVLGVLLLFVRLPHSTWPEQLGLLGALLGFALAGQFAWGIAVYAVARNVWLFRVVLNARM